MGYKLHPSALKIDIVYWFVKEVKPYRKHIENLNKEKSKTTRDQKETEAGLRSGNM